MVIELVVASNNKKKLRELREILAHRAPGLSLLSAAEVGLGDIDETGTTFRENALIKALAAWRATRKLALADDSGLEVDALGGAPGVYSARYAGPSATDADNNAKVQMALAETPDALRTARYRCVIALVVPIALAEAVGAEPVTGEPEVAHLFAEGSVEGLMLRAPRGEGGFGYDPYMLYPPAGLTFAELPAEAKHAISHRGQALEVLTPLLLRLLAASQNG
jgi:XTP/dITP diphosphohydrolase